MDEATSSDIIIIADVHVPDPESGRQGGTPDDLQRREAGSPGSDRPKRELDTIDEDEIHGIVIQDQAPISSNVSSGSGERRKKKRPLFKKKKRPKTPPSEPKSHDGSDVKSRSGSVAKPSRVKVSGHCY